MNNELKDLKSLLIGIGASDEAAEQILEAMSNYTTKIKDKYLTEYKNRIEEMKKITLEQFGVEKTKLAKKVRLFIESKLSEIEEHHNKVRVKEESNAENKLREVLSVINDYALNEEQITNVKQLQEEREQLSKDKDTLKKERDELIKKYNDAASLAESLLAENRELQNKARTEDDETITEDEEKGEDDETITEGEEKTKSDETITEGEEKTEETKSDDISSKSDDWISKGLQKAKIELHENDTSRVAKKTQKSSKKKAPGKKTIKKAQSQVIRKATEREPTEIDQIAEQM